MSDFLGDSTLQLRKLFRRCVVCPAGASNLACPACGDNQVCTQKAQTCDACISLICVGDSSSASTNSNTTTKSTSIGPIIGGVVAGVAVLLIAGFLIWKFWYKPRKQATQEKENGFTLGRNGRNSTNTLGSVVDTIHTRASNVIQIAYVPGSNTARTSVIPDVPPLPGGGDAYFRNGTPGSHFTAMDDDDPRASINTIDYGGGNATKAPVQTAIRATAALISVKSAGVTNPSSPTSKLGQYVLNANISEAPSSSTSVKSQVYELGGSSFIAELSGVPSDGQRTLNNSQVSESVRAPSRAASRARSPLSQGHSAEASHLESILGPAPSEQEEVSLSVPKPTTDEHVHESTIEPPTVSTAPLDRERANSSPFSDTNRVE